MQNKNCTWDQYRSAFIELAQKSNKSKPYIRRCLEYAEPIFERGLPIIFDVHHLSKLTGRSAKHIFSLSRFARCHYRSFSITKKSGGERRIDEPVEDLKYIQRWILHEILERLPVSPYAKAYVPGLSVRDNARFHQNQDKILTVDIKDFFPSVRSKSVFFVFRNAGYSDTVATILSNLCCLEHRLPQGAPTSPMLSNLVFSDLDKVIADFSIQRGLRYTRYADDLTISGSLDIRETLQFLYPLLNNRGFRLNPEKTRVLSRNMRQAVTGIVVNQYLQVPLNIRKNIRQDVFYIRKFGLKSHMEHIGETGDNYIDRLIVIVVYAIFVNPHDNEMKDYFSYLRSLKNDEKVQTA